MTDPLRPRRPLPVDGPQTPASSHTTTKEINLMTNTKTTRLGPLDEILTGEHRAYFLEHLPADWAVVSLDGCPLILVTEDGEEGSCLGTPCLCRTRLRDHAMLVMTAEGPRVVWQPYDVEPDALHELDVLARRHGLELTLRNSAPWHEWTFMLTFHRAAQR